MTTTNETTMTARYHGKCRTCGTRISAGSIVLWAKGLGVRHADCSSGTAAIPVARASGTSELRNGRWVPVSRRTVRDALREQPYDFDHSLGDM
jgi:hypothetical protein